MAFCFFMPAQRSTGQSQGMSALSEALRPNLSLVGESLRNLELLAHHFSVFVSLIMTCMLRSL